MTADALYLESERRLPPPSGPAGRVREESPQSQRIERERAGSVECFIGLDRGSGHGHGRNLDRPLPAKQHTDPVQERNTLSNDLGGVQYGVDGLALLILDRHDHRFGWSYERVISAA